MIVAVVGLVIIVFAWVGVRALLAKGELESARAEIGDLRTQALSLDVATATATFDQISARTDNARSLTGDVIWRAMEILPLLGPNLTAVRQIAELVDDTVDDVAAPLVSVSTSIDPASFTPKDGALDLAPLAAAVGPVSEANTNLSAILERAEAIPTAGTIGQVQSATTEMVGMIEEIAPVLSTLDVATSILPGALGADGPRYYVLMFQNPAEPRALGGAALSFTLVETNQGRITLLETKAAATGAFSRYGESVIPIPDGAEVVYPNGEFGTFIPEATARPSFTTAGQIVSEMWKREFGQQIDGVLSLDPVALSYLLRATGKIPTPGGDVLEQGNLVSLLLNRVYLRYASYSPTTANFMHDALYAQVVVSVFDRLTTGPLDATQLVGALAQGWNERRIMFWSAREDEQSILSAAGLNGELPITDGDTVRAGLYFQDSVGSKLSYYLRQSVQLSEETCGSEGNQNYRVQAALTNTIDGVEAQTMPFHITGEWKRVGLSPGLNRMTVRLYAPPGSTITGATIDGAPVALEAMHDTDYPVGKMIVEVAPGATVTIAYDFTLPGDSARGFEAQVTPLVTPTAIESAPLDCATLTPAL